MIYAHIDSIEPGQYLGKAIFSSNGTTLLSGGVQLTVYTINQLKRIGVTMLYIKDPSFDDVEIVEIVSDETKKILIKQMNETFSSIRSGKEFNVKNVSASLEHLLDDVMHNKELLVQLSDIRTEDNAQYVHAINVAMMSIVIGLNMDLSQSQLKELAIGALLHDIGKVGQKGEEESLNPKHHHTWRGFDIIKKDFSLMSAHISLQHHETPDGSGLPRGLVSDQIHLYAKIVAAANMFDNLLFDLSLGRRMLPHEACEHLMALAGTKVDLGVLLQFFRSVSVYPTGTSVRLSNRETGVVVGQHRGLPSRPIVRVVSQDSEDDDISVKEIDLARHTTMFIESVLS